MFHFNHLLPSLSRGFKKFALRRHKLNQYILKTQDPKIDFFNKKQIYIHLI